jgi:type I restriction enzyme, S subunit
VSFPRYPRYKDSGVEWLGQVPEHWDVKRIGYYFTERREKVSDKDFSALSVTKSGIVPQLETAAKSDDGDNRKKVCKGDFVINSRSDRKGSAGLSEIDGSVSLICTVLRPQEAVHMPFIHHLLRSQPFQEEFYRNGKGIVADLWSTNYSEMRNILVGMPSLSEQTAISSFLDRETGKIDELVAEQKRLMELLKEKRQAVISYAVTHGLNPKAPLKPSGIEWLGEVPQHWEVKKIKHIALSIEQGWSPQCEGFAAEGEGEWGVLKVGCVNGGSFIPSENKLLPSELAPIPSLAISHGDLLISRANTRELVGSAAVAERDYPTLMLCDKLYRVRFDPMQASPYFVSMYLGACVVRGQIELGATGASSSMVNIGQAAIMDLVMPSPPIKEQQAIVAHLNTELAKFDALTAEAERAIDLLKERRTALISAAVTGQIKVV